jgi:hypothetical protein
MTLGDPHPSRPSDSFRGRYFNLISAMVLLTALAVAPFFLHLQDVYGCWLNWSRVTRGRSPWNLYLSPIDAIGRPLDCNYPPFVLYLLTAVQAVINALSLSQFGAAAVLLVKLPNLFCLIAGGWICRAALAPIFGIPAATRVGILYLCCVPLWFNAAIWGQWDALLCLAMICAVMALIREKPVLAGAALGWALSIKLQAVVIVPGMLVFAFRTRSIASGVKFLITAVLAWSLIAAPFFIAGAGHGVLHAYFGAVDHYPLLSVCAANPWMALQTWSRESRNWIFPFGRLDDEPLIGSITAKTAGLCLFAGYTLFLMAMLWRRPMSRVFLQACAMTAFAFFMLPTEMHERYILPACALFALLAGTESPWFYCLICAAATANQLVALLYENVVARSPMAAERLSAYQSVFLVLSIANTALLVIATARFVMPQPKEFEPLRRREIEQKTPNNRIL